MKINVLKNAKSQVELEITVEAQEVEPFLDKAAKNLGKDLEIPGFRKGNAPYDILKQKVGEPAIWQEAADMVIAEKLLQAVKQENLEIAAQPQVEITKLAPNNDLIFKANFATVPKVKVGDYKKLKVKNKEIKIDDKKIDKTLQDIRKMRAKETIVEREAKMGDKVLIDIEMFNNKVPIEGGQQKGVVVILGDSYFIPGLDKEVAGLKAGEKKEFTLDYPKDYHDKNLAGKKVDFKIKVNSIYEMELPELNDEFIKGLGNFKNTEDLKKHIRQNLEQEEAQKVEQQLETEVLTKVIECCDFDAIPESLIEGEIERMFGELKSNVESQGVKFEDYLLQLKKKPEDIKEGFKDQAEKRIKVSLAIRQIGQDEKIKVEEKDIDAEIGKITAMYPDNEDVKKQVSTPTYRNRLAEIVSNQKTVEHLKNHILDNKNKTDDSKETKSKDAKKSDN